jgi:hypothetical protein
LKLEKAGMVLNEFFYDLGAQDNPLDIKTIRKSLKRQGLIAKAATLFKMTTIIRCQLRPIC